MREHSARGEVFSTSDADLEARVRELAAGLGFAILAQGQIKKTSNSWLFLVFSYVGSLLAVFLFEFIYKRAMPSDEPPEEDEEDHHDSLLSPTNQ